MIVEGFLLMVLFEACDRGNEGRLSAVRGVLGRREGWWEEVLGV